MHLNAFEAVGVGWDRGVGHVPPLSHPLSHLSHALRNSLSQPKTVRRELDKPMVCGPAAASKHLGILAGRDFALDFTTEVGWDWGVGHVPPLSHPLSHLSPTPQNSLSFPNPGAGSWDR